MDAICSCQRDKSYKDKPEMHLNLGTLICIFTFGGHVHYHLCHSSEFADMEDPVKMRNIPTFRSMQFIDEGYSEMLVNPFHVYAFANWPDN